MRPEQPPHHKKTPGEPFTVIVCHGQACGKQRGESVVEGLRPCIRRHRHGVLMSAGCLLGRLTCHALSTGGARRTPGTLLIVQPCSTDRTPIGPAMLVGPIATDNDVAAVRDWLDSHELRTDRLPARLRRLTFITRHGAAN